MYCPNCNRTFFEHEVCTECGGALIEKDKALGKKFEQLSEGLRAASNTTKREMEYGRADEQTRRKIFLRGLRKRAKRAGNKQRAQELKRELQKL